MKPHDKEARALKRQIRYLLRVSGGRLGLESRPKLLSKVGRFLNRWKFGSRREASHALGISPSQLRHLEDSYRKLPRSKNKVSSAKKLKLARVKIVDEPMTSVQPAPRGLELMLESGVKVSVGSADAAIDLLERLEQRKRFRSAS